jgi:hypothetical protein
MRVIVTNAQVLDADPDVVLGPAGTCESAII